MRRDGGDSSDYVDISKAGVLLSKMTLSASTVIDSTDGYEGNSGTSENNNGSNSNNSNTTPNTNNNIGAALLAITMLLAKARHSR